MKHGKNPTRKQKMFLKRCHLNADNWLVVKDNSQCFEIAHRLTGTIKRMDRTVQK